MRKMVKNQKGKAVDFSSKMTQQAKALWKEAVAECQLEVYGPF